MKSLRIYVDLPTPPEILTLLRDGTRGHELVLPENPVASVLAKAEPDPRFATADIAFGQPDPAAIRGATQLKWVHISSSGITRYDTPEFREAMKQRGIAVSNSAGVYDEACAVHALSFLLGQARRLPQSLRTRTESGSAAWHGLRGASSTLRGETVIIIGYGAIGKRLTELLKPFGANVVAHRRKSSGDEAVPVVDERQLPGAFAKADHVVNILPDSASTRNFFHAGRFASFKPGAAFYNIGRGATVDQTALLDALNSGRLAAAWLDVTDPEPLPKNHPLLAAPNCFITPHVAGGHANEAGTQVRHFLANFERFIAGKPLVDRVM